MITVFHSAAAQRLPSDREKDGLKGNVHFVVEHNIGTKQIITGHDTCDTTILVSKPRWLFKKKTKMVELDTIIVKPIITEVRDTHYYCCTEYTPEGYVKSRLLVKAGDNVHEHTATTFYNHQKIEMRDYREETGETTQWLYFYSINEKESRLEQTIVTQYKQQGEGFLIERVEYEYENDGETCLERHFSASGEMTKTIKYENGILTDIETEQDSNIHYIYNSKGQLSEVEVYNANYDLMRTDNYNYTSNGVQITSIPADKRLGRKVNTSFIDTYDGAGNWRTRNIDGKEKRERYIIFY